MFSSSSSSNQEGQASQNATSYDDRSTCKTEQDKFIDPSEIDDVSSSHDSYSLGWVDSSQKPLNKPPWLLNEPLDWINSFCKVLKVFEEICQNKEYKWEFKLYRTKNFKFLYFLFYSLKLQTPNSNYIPSIRMQFHIDHNKYHVCLINMGLIDEYLYDKIFPWLSSNMNLFLYNINLMSSKDLSKLNNIFAKHISDICGYSYFESSIIFSFSNEIHKYSHISDSNLFIELLTMCLDSFIDLLLFNWIKYKI